MMFHELTCKYGNRRVQRTLHISEKFRYLYVSNQKAASTTLKLYLSRAELGDPDFIPERYHDRKTLPLLRPGDIDRELLSCMLDEGFFKFSFVRHPIKRIVSAYGDKILTCRTDRFKRQILQYLGRDENDVEQEVSFKEFLEAIDSQDTSTVDGHFRPQVYNLYFGDIDYDFIGKLENMNEDFFTLKRRLGLPDYPLVSQNVKSNVIKVSEFMDEKCERLIRKIYANDFEVFGYE